MKRIVVICALLFAANAFAQDIRQSVEVTNTFQSRDLEFDKKGVDLYLPDSMSVFRSTFNYKIFTNPYKGSSTFNPYQVYFVPQESREPASRFYLSAGAGYRLAPEMTAVFSPRSNGKSSFTITNSFDGYLGKYYAIDYGRDLHDQATVLFKTQSDKFAWGASLDYSYYNTLYQASADEVHSAALSVDLASISERNVSFDGTLKVASSYNTYLNKFLENSVGLSGTVRPHKLWDGNFAADFSTGYNDLTGIDGQKYFHISVLPHYCLVEDNFSLKAGFKMAYMADAFFFNPYVNGSLDLFKNKLNLYFGVDGGARPLSYRYYKAMNHFVCVQFLDGGYLPAYVKDNYILFAGVQTCLYERLALSAKVSYDDSENTALYCMSKGLPVLTAAPYRALTASAEATLNLENFTAKVNARYRDANITKDVAFTEARWAAGTDLEYRLMRRLRCDLALDYMSAREFGDYRIDPIWDLSLRAKYLVSQGFYIYLKGANLLCNRLEYFPGFARKGVCVTGGICLEIR